MSFFRMFTISPEERLEHALDSIFKDKEYKYFALNLSNIIILYTSNLMKNTIPWR